MQALLTEIIEINKEMKNLTKNHAQKNYPSLTNQMEVTSRRLMSSIKLMLFLRFSNRGQTSSLIAYKNKKDHAT